MTVAILREAGWAMAPQSFGSPLFDPQFLLHFPTKFVSLTYTVDNFRPASDILNDYLVTL